MRIGIGFMFIFSLMAFSCISERPTTDVKTYLFLGHTYDWFGYGERVDPRIEKLNLKSYDQIWLGGDMCSETTKKESTITYMDKLFDLSSDDTHWAIGNHDFRNGNLEYITNATKRPHYYAQHSNGITVLVMNVFMEHPFYLDSCAYKQQQHEYVSEVLDTIQRSSHLVVLMHNVVWSDVDAELEASAQPAANAPGQWMDMLCDDHSKFSQLYYPQLLSIQQRGVQVVIISGDGGQFHKGYYKKAKSGIEYYISGINNSFDRNNEKLNAQFNSDADSILIFKHDTKQKTLTGDFVQLNSYH